MATYVKYQCFVKNMAEGVHNFASHSCKIMLSNTAPVVGTHTVRADATEIAAGNGYTSGGLACALSSSTQTAGTYKLVLSDPGPWTASGGSIGPFRYVILYNDTPTSPADPLIAYWDYGSSITLNTGETFTADLDQANGVFTVT